MPLGKKYILVIIDNDVSGTIREREYVVSQTERLSVDMVIEAGMTWITKYPEDIAMLVEVHTSRCKHCGRGIHEKAGWILHRWTHVESGAYLCHDSLTNQATPEDA